MLYVMRQYIMQIMIQSMTPSHMKAFWFFAMA